MPPPYLSADEIDGLLAVLPLYCYFPKLEWDNIRRAEKNDEEGMRIRQQYSDIYSRDFLGENQDAGKSLLTGQAGHWGEDPTAYFKGTPDRMDNTAVLRLMETRSPLAP